VNIGGSGGVAGRGGVNNLFVSWGVNYLYVGVQGPTVPFANWNGPSGGGMGDPDDGDQGDLYIAIDASGDEPGALEQLVANDAHSLFRGAGDPQAVDFLGWQPTHFIGVDWVDNGAPGSNLGWANLEVAGTHAQPWAEGHGMGDGGFEWAAGYDGTQGTYEFRVPWVSLGYAEAPAAGTPFHFAMYTTANFDYSDTYDSAPGIGNASHFEQIGDCPGDLDTGTGDDGLGSGIAGSFGVPAGSYPGANYVDPVTYNYGAMPNLADEIDTIQEYLTARVPEPSTVTLLGLALLSVWIARRRRA